jgi:hypothetical protein
MQKRKVSLEGSGAASRPSQAVVQPSTEVLDFFFNTGVIHHEVPLATPFPDFIAGYKVVESADQRAGFAVRRAKADEEPDVEISALEHLPELSNRWLPCPYQFSCATAVQVYLRPDGRNVRVLLAIDTLESSASDGRHLDAALDAGRPYRPLDASELGSFLDEPMVRTFMRDLQTEGIDRAPFKVAALLETLHPLLPRIRLSRVADHTAVPVSLVLDFGNSRSCGVLAESKEGEVSSVPLAIRDSSNPFSLTEESFGSRVVFYPSAFDATERKVAVGSSFLLPSLTRLGREALDRALETPHRYQCSISGPKRYLWDSTPAEDRWFFALAHENEYRPISGHVLKHLDEHGDGLALREDGPTTPADPRYAARSMMLFAMIEVLQQALSQINSIGYRVYQGREGLPRILRHLVLTFPSAMRSEEKAVYEALVRHAVILSCHYLNIAQENRPNWNAAASRFDPFLHVDEALASQMVYVYQEIVHSFGGSMEELARIYGRDQKTLRIGSVDIGGGTTDVMVAEYKDLMPGGGTALHAKKLFQDGIAIAGDDVCKAICEDIVLEQILHQIPNARGRRAFVQLLAEADAGYGAEWRTLKAKLVPYFWLPLARANWALAEDFEIPDHAPDKQYGFSDACRIFGLPASSPSVLAEGDSFLGRAVPGWPGLTNLFFKFEADGVARSVERILREPLRKYADILAQFDIDLLVLAGRTSKLRAVRHLFVSEMPVAPPRIKTMGDFRVGDWYPSRWRKDGRIADPKSTVSAGAAILHLAARNQLPGLLLEGLEEIEQKPIYGLYQDVEPHIARVNELFRNGKKSEGFLYTRGMRIGFRNVDSEEMEGTPLFEVLPAHKGVETALLEDRVRISFRENEAGAIEIADVKSQRGTYTFAPADFVLKLKTATVDRYWLDTGILGGGYRIRSEEDEAAK